MPTQNLTARIGTDVSGFNRGMGSALGVLNRFKGTLLGVGTVVTGGMFLKSAIQEAMEFVSELADIQKVTSAGVMQRLISEIDTLTREIPLARSQITKIIEDAGRLGVQGTENISQFTETMSKVSVATNITADNAGKQFARIAAITQTPISQLENLGSVVNELSNTMATSSSEIADGMLRSSAAASQFGLTAPQIAAVSGTINEVSASARRGNTRLRRLFQQLTNPRKIQIFADALDVTQAQFKAMRRNNPLRVLTQLAQVMRRDGRAAANLRAELTTTSRVALAGLAQNLDSLNDALGDSGEQWEKNTSLQREFNIQSDTAASRMQLLRNQNKKLTRQIGEAALPMWTAFQEHLLGALDAINKLIFRQTELNRALSSEFGAKNIDKMKDSLQDVLNVAPSESIDFRRSILGFQKAAENALPKKEAQQVADAIIDNVNSALAEGKSLKAARKIGKQTAIQLINGLKNEMDSQGKDTSESVEDAIPPNDNVTPDDISDKGGEAGEEWKQAFEDGVEKTSIIEALGMGATIDEVQQRIQKNIEARAQSTEGVRELFRKSGRDVRARLQEMFGKETFKPVRRQMQRAMERSPFGGGGPGIGAGARGVNRDINSKLARMDANEEKSAKANKQTVQRQSEQVDEQKKTKQEVRKNTEAVKEQTRATMRREKKRIQMENQARKRMQQDPSLQEQGVRFGGPTESEMRQTMRSQGIRFGGPTEAEMQETFRRQGIRFGGRDRMGARKRSIDFEPVEQPVTLEIDGERIARKTLKMQPKERRRVKR